MLCFLNLVDSVFVTVMVCFASSFFAVICFVLGLGGWTSGLIISLSKWHLEQFLKCGCTKIPVYGHVLADIGRFQLVYYVSDVQNLYVHHLVHYVSADIWNSNESRKFYPVVGI